MRRGAPLVAALALSCATTTTTTLMPPASEPLVYSAPDPEISSEAYRAVLEAELELQEGNVPGGIARLREAVLHDPASAYLRVRLAEAWLEAGDAGQAREAGQEALAITSDPRHAAAALRVVGRAWAATGEAKRARTAYQGALASSPADRETSSLLAELLVEQGDLAGAEEVIETLMSNEPGAIDGFVLLAGIFAARGDLERASIHVERALSREHADAVALALKLKLLWSEGRFVEALPAARALASVQGGAPEVRRDLLSALALAGAYGDAEVLADAWLEENDAEEVRLAIAEGWERAGELTRARAVLNPQEKPRGGNGDNRALPPRFAAEVARLYLQQGEVARAKDTVCPLVDVEASASIASLVLSTCTRALVRADRPQEAGVLLLKRVTVLGPSLGASAAVLVDAMTRVAKAGGLDRERALRLVDQALAEEHDEPDIIALVARAHEELGDVDGARAILDEALRARPSSPDLLFSLAHHLDRQRQPLPALEIVERLIERGQTGVDELNFAAFALAEAGVRLAEAPRLAWRALVQDPLNGYVLDTLGWALLQQGDVDGALRTLQRADRLSPGEGELLFHLACALERKGDRGARAVALRAQELLDGDEPLRARIDQLLARLADGTQGTP